MVQSHNILRAWRLLMALRFSVSYSVYFVQQVVTYVSLPNLRQLPSKTNSYMYEGAHHTRTARHTHDTR